LLTVITNLLRADASGVRLVTTLRRPRYLRSCRST